MQVSELVLDTNGNLEIALQGNFVKIQKVPSGNTLFIKTTGAAPEAESGQVYNEGETFEGIQGQSIKFDNQFQKLEISGGAASETIVLQTGFGWILGGADVTATISGTVDVDIVGPDPLPVEIISPLPLPVGMFDEPAGVVINFKSWDGNNTAVAGTVINFGGHDLPNNGDMFNGTIPVVGGTYADHPYGIIEVLITAGGILTVTGEVTGGFYPVVVKAADGTLVAGGNITTSGIYYFNSGGLTGFMLENTGTAGVNVDAVCLSTQTPGFNFF